MENQFAVEFAGLGAAEVERLTAQIWADLAFDETAKAALKRDGVVLDGLRLTGPNPFAIGVDEGGRIAVSAPDRVDAEVLIDLWRVHFMRRVRELAATGPRRDVA